MKYDNTELRERLSAEYVLGTLRGAARARFQALMKYDAPLRAQVAAWEARLTPLAHAAAPVMPPARLWDAIAARIAPRVSPAPPRRVAFWRTLAAGMSTLALLLAMYIAARPAGEPPMAMVAVLKDERSLPAMVVSWPADSRRRPYLKVDVVQAHPQMDRGTAWELWVLPTGKRAPISLGLVTTDRAQTLELAPAQAGMMVEAGELAMSLEPEGGSKTGAPTGPVLFRGECVKLPSSARKSI